MENYDGNIAFQNLLNGKDILVVCGDRKERDYLIKRFIETIQTNRYLVTRKNALEFTYKNKSIKFFIFGQATYGFRFDRIYITDYAYKNTANYLNNAHKDDYLNTLRTRLNFGGANNVEVMGQRETGRWSKISSTLQRWMHSMLTIFNK